MTLLVWYLKPPPCRAPQHCGVFCHAKYRGGVTQGRRGWKRPAVKVAEVRSPLPLLVTDEIGGVPAGRGGKEIPAVETETGINLFPFRDVSERKVQ